MTFTQPSELDVLRAELEMEGIEVMVLDELTTQMNPMYSNAIGGVKLQVKQSDIPRTIEILKRDGYIDEGDLKPSEGTSKLDRIISKLPRSKSRRVEVLLVIACALVLSWIAYLGYLKTLPSTFERLTKQNWCVNQLVYKGQELPVNTVQHIKMSGLGICWERITFNRDGTIDLPGSNTPAANGKWKLTNNSLQITETDTLANIYNGLYEIGFSKSGLTLKSEVTTFYCRPEVIDIYEELR